VYDTWYDYYSEFAGGIYDFVKQSYRERKISKKVLKAVELSYERLDKILCDSNGKPTLIHGDYWQPNFIVNRDTYKLVGIIDPFNIMWTEPEYELFALTVGGSKKLKLYETYKSRIVPTKYCDLKVEMYALYNELLWYKKLGSISKGYLLFRSRRLIKQMKRNGLI
ncbi:MAG: fructosamine kinase family protein, partial [Eubacterium sp.]|nr:fructosamine kinase family protein [Eubacterium sp.]